MKKLGIGIIGMGRMGKEHLATLIKSDKWDVRCVCDTDPARSEGAKEIAPQVKFTLNEDDIFLDPTIDVVALCALADVRFGQIEKAIKHGKHVFAEKPLAIDLLSEEKAVEMAEKADLITATNLCLRSSLFVKEINDFIQSGEIGSLAIIRICHMTPGLAPGEGHEAEGPSFHDCGIHYVDLARWFAHSEFKTAHAQAIRMWSYKDPWWLQCHGTFENGVVFDITQGHVYAQLAKVQTHNSYIDIIGTKGIVRMTHDFKTATIEKRGVNVTDTVRLPHGDKNMGRMYDLLAEAVLSGNKNNPLPTFRDAYVASKFAWDMLHDASAHDMPAIGSEEELEEIRRRRAAMKNGYGLLR